MVETSEIPIRRKRVGFPKVRTGCITCKIRHVKCDEQKPACNRCTSTGRKCDGYASRPGKSTAPADNESQMQLAFPARTEKFLVTSNVTDLEHHALDYFFNRAAPMLGVYVDPVFWNRVVPQLGHSEPAIRHAMITIGAAYEQMERHRKLLSAEASTNFSLHHYNKSLNHLIHSLSSDDHTAEISLVTCILFICLESIQGDVDRVLTLISRGVKIMEFWQRNMHKRAPVLKEIINEGEDVVHYIIRTFAWLCNVSLVFHPPSEITQEEENFVGDPEIFPCTPPEFTSVYMARLSLYNPMERTIQFMRSVLFRKYSFEILPKDEAEHAGIKALLDCVHFCVETFIRQNHSFISLREQEALIMAQMHFEVASIWIRTALETEESSFDQYLPEFVKIVDLCEPLVFCSPPFTFNVGYIAPLLFVACKCRDRLLRRRAVALLCQVPSHREVLCTAEQAYKIAVRVIQLEEAGMDSSMGFPAECMRIHFAHISHKDSVPSGSGRLVPVTFFSKPDGLREEWKLHVEYMDLSSGIIDPFEELTQMELLEAVPETPKNVSLGALLSQH